MKSTLYTGLTAILLASAMTSATMAQLDNLPKETSAPTTAAAVVNANSDLDQTQSQDEHRAQQKQSTVDSKTACERRKARRDRREQTLRDRHNAGF